MDLGASVNIFPYSVYKKIRPGKLKSTSIVLQLVDRSMKISCGIIEDMFIQIDKFYYLVDFFLLILSQCRIL